MLMVVILVVVVALHMWSLQTALCFILLGTVRGGDDEEGERGEEDSVGEDESRSESHREDDLTQVALSDLLYRILQSVPEEYQLRVKLLAIFRVKTI